MATIFIKKLNEILQKKVDINQKFSFLISQLCDDVEEFVKNEKDAELMTLEEPVDLIDDEKYAIRLDIKDERNTIIITISKRLIAYEENSPIIELIYQNTAWSGKSESDFTENEKIELIKILEQGMSEVTEKTDNEQDVNEYLNTNNALYPDENKNDTEYEC